MKTKIKDYRGVLIKTVISTFTDSYLSANEFKEQLQEKLNLNLKFKTTVSDMESKNDYLFGNVYFECEDDVIRVIGFSKTIIKTNEYK